MDVLLPTGGRGRGVLVVHPWWGLNRTIRDYGAAIAQQGFVVGLPDLFDGAVATEPSAAEALVDSHWQQAVPKLRAALGELDIPHDDLRFAELDDDREATLVARDPSGDVVHIRAYGRDEREAQLLSKAWRFAWYSESGAPLVLTRLQQEHRVIAHAADRLLEHIDAILQGAMVPRAAVESMLATYLVYYGNHIAKEEEDVLPRAAKELDARDWRAVKDSAPSGLDPVFGLGSEERYRELRRQIALDA